MSLEDRLFSLRRTADIAAKDLHDAVIAACPGPHEPVQHRDRKPPWCPKCGRTNRGVAEQLFSPDTG